MNFKTVFALMQLALARSPWTVSTQANNHRFQTIAAQIKNHRARAVVVNHFQRCSSGFLPSSDEICRRLAALIIGYRH